MSRTIEDVLAVAGNRRCSRGWSPSWRPERPSPSSVPGLRRRCIRFGRGSSSFLRTTPSPRARPRTKTPNAGRPTRPLTRSSASTSSFESSASPLYRNFLRATFGPRKGPDGRRYTPTHAALLRLPFRGYVTTNYDPALEFARAELRPESLSTGTPNWGVWRTGEVFADDCPAVPGWRRVELRTVRRINRVSTATPSRNCGSASVSPSSALASTIRSSPSWSGNSWATSATRTPCPATRPSRPPDIDDRNGFAIPSQGKRLVGSLGHRHVMRRKRYAVRTLMLSWKARARGAMMRSISSIGMALGGAHRFR